MILYLLSSMDDLIYRLLIIGIIRVLIFFLLSLSIQYLIVDIQALNKIINYNLLESE